MNFELVFGHSDRGAPCSLYTRVNKGALGSPYIRVNKGAPCSLYTRVNYMCSRFSIYSCELEAL